MPPRSPPTLAPAILAAVLLAAIGCGDQLPPPPRDAAQACFAAIAAAGERPVSALRESLACRRLYRDAPCGEAWERVAAAPDPADLMEGLGLVRDRCRRACLRLSHGSPPRACVAAEDRYGLGDSPRGRLLTDVMEIDRGLHELAGLSADEAARLASRTAILATGPAPDVDRGIAIDLPPALPGSAAPSGDGLRVEVKLGTILIGGAVVAKDDLRATIEAELAHNPTTVGIIVADPDVAYTDIVAVMDAARAAGITDIQFSVGNP